MTRIAVVATGATVLLTGDRFVEPDDVAHGILQGLLGSFIEHMNGPSTRIVKRS
jgi:hypothetical protein